MNFKTCFVSYFKKSTKGLPSFLAELMYVPSSRDLHSRHPKDVFYRSNNLLNVVVFEHTLYLIHSLRNSIAENIVYDFVIVDESSQVDLATGVLALSYAKRAVFVGDLKQLPNVVTFDNVQKTDLIFQSFNLPEPYRYSNHS